MRALHPPDDSPAATRRRRLLFRAHHRGTHETDLIVGRFAEAHVPAMSDSDLSAFEAILELPDPDLFDWVTGRAAVPPEHDSPLLRKLIIEQGPAA